MQLVVHCARGHVDRRPDCVDEGVAKVFEALGTLRRQQLLDV